VGRDWKFHDLQEMCLRGLVAKIIFGMQPDCKASPDGKANEIPHTRARGGMMSWTPGMKVLVERYEQLSVATIDKVHKTGRFTLEGSKDQWTPHDSIMKALRSYRESIIPYDEAIERKHMVFHLAQAALSKEADRLYKLSREMRHWNNDYPEAMAAYEAIIAPATTQKDET
jgi:hypothetical protein